MAAHHEVLPSPDTVQWGAFDAAYPAVLTIASGDTLTLHSVSGGPDELPPVGGGHVYPEHRAIHAAVPRGPGPHIITGPVAVEGAMPGDVLQVDILDVKLRQDWGYNVVKPLAGGLPNDFAHHSLMNIEIDRLKNVVHMPWGLEIPARPFFGIMGVAPPRAWGRVTSVVPRSFGGNIDNKELVAGTTLLLPVHEPGALFCAGDGHAVQGDGEVCLTAVETGLTGSFRLTVLKGRSLDLPRAETPTHLITMAFDEDLDDAVEIALRDMICLIQERSKLNAEQAYRLCSLVADLRITQIVNLHKGVHVMLPRWALQGS